MSIKKRGSFSGKFGTIAAATGSAIGLGNIWRFPYVVGENGGAAFILVYLLIIFLVGLPILMSEFCIGRATQKNVFGAFHMLAPKKKWYLIGVLGIVSSFVIMSFYSVVAGWTMAFLQGSITNSFSGMDSAAIGQHFDNFVANGWEPILWLIAFIGLASVIVAFGVEKGIERYNKILMPMLFVIIIILCANSFTLSGFNEGMQFLFHPDFSKISPTVVLNALGQAFFSLSLGMGTMVTYGSYMQKSDNLLSTSSSVAVADFVIAMLAGIAIFPAVFSFGIAPGSGPDLVFKTLPNIFQQMTGGYYLSILFFMLLVVAALTSIVSIMEVVVAYFTEELKISRIKSVILISVGSVVCSVFCAMSLMPESQLSVGGVNLFNLFDNGSSAYLLPIGGFFLVVYTGWFMDKKILRDELSSQNAYKTIYFPIFNIVVKYIAPVAIAAVFLSKI